MSGIYIHIPFCKQACHYCDFHFSTSLKKKEEMVLALANEIALRKAEFKEEVVETIYFGGGTPSVLEIADLRFLIDTVYENYKVVDNPEITVEANPDDLKLMNRAHNSEEAQKSLELASQYFDNISIDLIYGIPGMTNEKWLQNIEKALSYKIPHISSYALTVEPKTALHSFIQKGIIAQPDDEAAQEHFHLLVDTLEQNGFLHYELSNFGKEAYFSINNSSYWLGKKYLGIGPSAHSYDGISRSWNVSNNTHYIKALGENHRPFETETLTLTDRYNEYVMTGLRTIWGVSLDRIAREFGKKYLDYLNQQAAKYIEEQLLEIVTSSDFEYQNRIEKVLRTTKSGKFLSDGIASDLFLLNLD